MATFAERHGVIGAEADTIIKDLEDTVREQADQLVSLNNEVTELRLLPGKLADTEEALAAAVAEIERLKDLYEPAPDPDPDPEPGQPVFYLGSSLHREPGETLQTAFNRREQTWGNVEPMAIRIFDEGEPLDLWPSIGDDDGTGSGDKPRPAIISFKLRPQDVMTGSKDNVIRAAFAACPANGVVHRWCFWHEIEDNIENGEFSRDQYRAAEDRVRTLAEAYDGTGRRLRRGWTGMGWTFNPQSGRDAKSFMPLVKPDFIGFDVYPGPTEADIKLKFGLCRDFAVAQGIKEYWLCEWGLHNPSAYDGQATADFLRRAVPIIKAQGFRGALYFDSTVGGDFRLDKDVERDAMGDMIRLVDPNQ